MKILKIFGIVVGIHVFALILIFANPGCSSTTKAQAPAETVAKAETPAPVTVPSIAPAPTAASATPPVTFSVGGADGRYAPTRPGSAPATIPAAPMPEKVTGVTPATTYTVVSGDNLSKIAKKVHVSASELAAANDIKLNAPLRPGQKLKVPGKPMNVDAGAVAEAPTAAMPAAKSEPAAARASGEVLKHTVKSGETLGAIAKHYEVRVADIAVANNISDPAKIKPGQELIIPGWDSKSAPKAGKNGKSTTAKKSDDAKAPPAEQPAAMPATPPPIVPIAPVDDNPIKPAPRP